MSVKDRLIALLIVFICFLMGLILWPVFSGNDNRSDRGE